MKLDTVPHKLMHRYKGGEEGTVSCFWACRAGSSVCAGRGVSLLDSAFGDAKLSMRTDVAGHVPGVLRV